MPKTGGGDGMNKCQNEGLCAQDSECAGREDIRWTEAHPWLGLLDHDKEFVFNPEYNGKPLKGLLQKSDLPSENSLW